MPKFTIADSKIEISLPLKGWKITDTVTTVVFNGIN